MIFKVMTFNIQHFANHNYKPEDIVEIDFFARHIQQQQADVVGLNEVFDTPSEKQVETAAKLSGFDNYYFAEAIKLWDRPYGNAMLSRYPFSGETISIPDPAPEELNGEYAETRCVLKSRVHIQGKEVLILCSHFGLNRAEARNAVETVCRIADNCDTPIVLMGDFNLCPDSPIMQPLFDRFTDTVQLVEGSSYTFPSDAPERKIDYILVRGAIRPISVQINKEVVSDHLSMTAVLELL